MKIEVETGALARALKQAQAVTERANTMPLLQHCLLTAEGQHLTVATTNMDASVEVRVPCAVIEAGRTTADARMLTHAAVTAPAGSTALLEIERAQRLLVRIGRSRHLLPSLDFTDFPVLRPIHTPEADFVAPLADWLGWAAPAMSSDETKYYIAGVWLTLDEGRLVIGATNGHVGLLRRIDPPLGCEGLKSSLVPSPVVSAIDRLFDGDVRVMLDVARIDVEAEGLRYSAKLSDASRPDLERAFSLPEVARYAVSRSALQEATKQLRLYDQRASINGLLRDGVLTLVCRSHEDGAVGRAEVDVTPVSGETDHVYRHAIDANYLTMMLATSAEDEVVLGLHDTREVDPTGANVPFMFSIQPSGGWDNVVCAALQRPGNNAEIEAALRGEPDPQAVAA